MFRFLRKLWRVLPSVIAGLALIVVIWLFVVFPRLVNQLADLLGNMGDPLMAREQLIHTVVALLASLVPLYFLIIRPFRQVKLPHDGQGLVVRQGQGVAYIDTESVRHQVYRAVAEIGAIRRTEVTVENDGGRAAILLNLVTENSINGARKKQEIRREVKKVVEDQLGVQLASEPTISFRLAQIEPDIPHAKPDPDAAPPRPAPVVSQPRRDDLPPAVPPPVAPTSAPIITRRTFVPTEPSAASESRQIADSMPDNATERDESS